MTYETIVQSVSVLGFPIIMCGAMGWYVKYITDKHREDMSKERELHKQEMENVTQALNNNTMALTKLCERMEG